MDVQSGSVFYLGLVLTCTGLDVPDFEKSSMYQNQIDFSIYKKHEQRFWGRVGGRWWTTFQRLEEWERMRSSPSPSAWDEAYHTRQPLQRSLWLAASSSSWASPDCGHWWFASSRKCQGEYLANDEGNAWKSEVFFEVVWGCGDFFSAISAIQTSYRPKFWWPTGEPRYWCWCWPLSVLHRIPKLRRHLF